MVKLLDARSGQELGTISEEQLLFLQQELEEEFPEDGEYYIEPATLEMFEEEGGDPALLALLRQALDGRDGMDLTWTRR
jgi:hypothetical protein